MTFWKTPRIAICSSHGRVQRSSARGPSQIQPVPRGGAVAICRPSARKVYAARSVAPGPPFSCMSATRFARAARPLGRSLAALNKPCAAGRQRFATSAFRRAANGSAQVPHLASAWPLSGVFAVAVAAGLLGWGASELRHRGFPGTVLLDSAFPAPRYASMREMEQALEEIRREIGGEDIISTDPDDLHAHGYSEWSSTNPEGLPVAVAYPRSTEQVSTIARICHKYRVPIIPYSGGSSLEGNFSAPFGGISVDFAFMDKIVQFNKEDMDVVVQPSIGWQDLNEQLAKMGSGLFFPIDPGPSAKIGGMIGTNCSGTNAVKYGTMKDWVINLTVVLADGTVIKTRRRPRKSSAGYNLNGIFVGSEGTLGLVTEATLKLAVVPEEFSVAVVTFPSIRDAASAAAEVMQTGVPVAAMEIMDEVQMKVVNMGGATAPRVWKEMPTLFFKFSGTKAGVKESIGLVQKITKAHRGAISSSPRTQGSRNFSGQPGRSLCGRCSRCARRGRKSVSCGITAKNSWVEHGSS
ncbi:hypothetical protein VTK56DRAFT_2650 [Thermocarpiscus australiensis]